MTFQPLNQLQDAKTQIAKFDCGEPTCNNYIKKLATQDIKRNRSKTFTLTNGDASGDLLSYYTIASTILTWETEHEVFKRYPSGPMTAALIARLAVHKDYQGQELGSIALIDAIKRIVTTNSIPFPAIVVDAIDNDAASFYEQFGFKRFKDESNRLFITTKKAEDLVSKL